MNSTKLVGVTGMAGSGKDSFTSFLIQAHQTKGCYYPDGTFNNYFAKRYAFADPVKDASAEMFGVPIGHFYDRELKELPDPFWGISPRKMAQLVGTDMARNVYDKEIWIKRAEKFINEHLDTSLIIISDVRFQNEADWIQSMGGIIVNIVRPNQEVIAESSHESENGIDFAKIPLVTISNNSTLSDLKALAYGFHSINIHGQGY